MYIRSPKELALLIINQRKNLDLSQIEVGKRVGLRQATISSFESKPEGARLATLFQILSAVGLEVHVMTKDKAEKEKDKWTEEW